MSTPRDGYGATATIGGLTFPLDGPWLVTPEALERVRQMAALPPIDPHNCRCEVFAADALTVVAAQALRDWTAEGGALGPPAEARADDDPAELLEPIIAYASPAPG